jgi:hypothetical protein
MRDWRLIRRGGYEFAIALVMINIRYILVPMGAEAVSIATVYGMDVRGVKFESR